MRNSSANALTKNCGAPPNARPWEPELLAAIRALGTDASRAKLASTLGWKPNATSHWLGRLAAAGVVSMLNEGAGTKSVRWVAAG